jgi:DNA-binding XRE family transcriptional regulator
MQAVVKTHLIEINIKGNIPHKILSVLKEEYGEEVKLYEDLDEEKVNIFETEWYRKTKDKISPGENLKIYREMQGITQQKLGEALGGIPRQHISNMERGMRKISLKTAQKLSQLFKVPVEKFL